MLSNAPHFKGDLLRNYNYKKNRQMTMVDIKFDSSQIEIFYRKKRRFIMKPTNFINISYWQQLTNSHHYLPLSNIYIEHSIPNLALRQWFEMM